MTSTSVSPYDEIVATNLLLHLAYSAKHYYKNESNENYKNEDEYEVDAIVDQRIRDGKHVEFLVQWKHYPSNEATWEPLQHVYDCEAFIAYCNRLGPGTA